MFAQTYMKVGGSLVTTGAILVSWGCGGNTDFGMAVRVAPERRITLETGNKTYPKDKPFNIHEAQRHSAGQAKAESHAISDGTALCAAQAKAGGSAWSEFQLGQCLDNRTNAKNSALVRFKIVYLHRTQSSDEAASGTTATIALKVYIKDSKGRLIRKLDLIAADSELGPARGQQTETCEFAFDMVPGLVYHYVLAGRAEATTAEKAEASTRLEIKSLQIDLETKPQPG